ncbi:MAG TPA: alcohol dehydrogenase catalytic domain-containing protein [Dehalococcoidia bacterium]|nr:alcohol dehydrogenase catalytic domain-containing protein [Dehalococcoidia bacterium]
MRQAYSAEEPGHFEIRDVDDSPAPGSGEVQMRVRACGVCGSDLHPLRSPERWQSGRVRGHEISGEIIAVGEDVEQWRPGDRVAVQPNLFCGHCGNCRSGQITLCETEFSVVGLTRPGGYSELLTLPQQNVFRLPDGVDFAVGALTEPLAVVAHGYRLAAELDSLRATTGERVLILGGGMIGLLAAFYARQAGAGEVAITARHEHQANSARQLGATRVFTADEDGEAALREWSQANPVDLVIESVGGGGSTLAQAMDAVRRGGRILVLGVASPGATMPVGSLIGKEVRLVGSLMYGYAGKHADYDLAIELERRFGDVLGTLITHRVPFDEIDRAHALALDKSSGSIKVTIEF